MEENIPIRSDHFTEVHTSIQEIPQAEAFLLRVVKKDKIHLYDENTYAKIKGLVFHNGTIRVQMRSRLLPDAPDFARGFIGIVFRANENDSEFESFYLRPTNGRCCTDPVRRAHGCQYFSYPGYTFEYFREFGITGYEAPTELALDEWFTLKAVIQDQRAEFYLNEDPSPVLVVPEMKHGTGHPGSVGIFVDIGTEALISEIQVTCAD